MKEIVFKSEEAQFIKDLIEEVYSDLPTEKPKIAKSIMNKLNCASKNIKTSSAKGKEL